MTLRTAIDELLAHAANVRRLSSRTLASYASDLRLFAAWCQRHRLDGDVGEITASHIEGWMGSRHRRDDGSRPDSPTG